MQTIRKTGKGKGQKAGLGNKLLLLQLFLDTIPHFFMLTFSSLLLNMSLFLGASERLCDCGSFCAYYADKRPWFTGR